MGLTAAEWALTIIAGGMLGLLVGSFLNVVAYRVPRGESVLQPPSHCPNCDLRLAGYDLVPVLSWLVLRGHCRRCRISISIRYPLVELATGVTFAGLAAAIHWVEPLPSIALVVGASLVAAVIDIDGAPVPRSVSWTAAAGAASLVAVALAVDEPARIGWAALGAALAGGGAALAQRAEGGQWAEGSEWLPEALIVGAIGCSAGWFWPIGGPLVAGWVVIAAAATWSGSVRRYPLTLAWVGGVAILATSALVARL